jgi:SAM-dependent methyltransferase
MVTDQNQGANLQGLLGKRFAFQSGKEFREMSPESRLAKKKFVSKYADEDWLQAQPCFVCEDSNWTVIGEIDRYGFFYPTALCGECGNVQQSQYYSDTILTDFYKNYYREIYGKPDPEEFFLKQRVGRGQAIWDFVTPVRTPQTVLEVGCGAGGILSVFRDKGCNVLGVDYDESYLEVARSKKIPVLQGSIEQIGSTHTFDLIILSHVLEHLVDPLKILGELRTLLTPAGILYIEVPSLEHVRNGGYGHDLLGYFQNAHVTHFTSETLRLLLGRAGFSRVKATDFIRSCWEAAETPQAISGEEKQASSNSSAELLMEIEMRRIRKSRSPRIFLRRKLMLLLSFAGLKRPTKNLYRRLRKLRGDTPLASLATHNLD